MKKRYTRAAATVAATMLFGVNAYAADAIAGLGGAATDEGAAAQGLSAAVNDVKDVNLGPSLEITKEVDVDLTVDTEIKPVFIDASKETNIDATVVSTKQDISAELKDLVVTTSAVVDAAGGNGLAGGGSGGSMSTADGSITTGGAMVGTGEGFGGIANFQTNSGVQSAVVGGVAVSSNANISFGQ